MSTSNPNPNVAAVGGPVTRAQRAAAGGSYPTPPSVDASIPVLFPFSSSPITVLSPDSAENDEKHELFDDSNVTVSEGELPLLSSLSELDTIRAQTLQVDERLKEMVLVVAKRQLLEKQKQLDALYALDVGTEGKFPPPFVIEKTAALPVAVSVSSGTETPDRHSLRPRMLAFQSTIGRKPPSAAALLYNAGVAKLPNLVNGGSAVNRSAPPEVQAVIAPVAEPQMRASSFSHRPNVRPVQPDKFTGDDATRNERVESWIKAVNVWMDLADIRESQHLVWARSLIATASGASEWLTQRDDELNYQGKAMTWEWLQGQLIQHYGQPSGGLAMAAEWQALRMGVKNVDGSETGGKSTWTVIAYNTLFLKYMRALTSHSIQTEEIVIIDRYVNGIKVGYETLYKTMLGAQKVLWFDTLKEAMDAAEIAEVTLTVSRIDKRSDRTASSSSSSSAAGGGRFTRGKRQPTEALNNVEGSTSGEGIEGSGESAPAAPSEPTRVFGFQYRGPGPKDGRYPCKEAEQKILYENGQCFRCQTIHPFGAHVPRCALPPCKTAPKRLK